MVEAILEAATGLTSKMGATLIFLVRSALHDLPAAHGADKMRDPGRASRQSNNAQPEEEFVSPRK
jgi:hypothetical protein